MYSAMPLLAAVLACSLLFAAAAPAPAPAPAPADDAAAATTMAPPPGPPGPLAQAVETLIKEGPERVKKIGEDLRAEAAKIRGRLQEDFAKLVPTPTKAPLLHKLLHHKTAASTASTTSTPPTSSSSPTAWPRPQDSDGPGLGPTTLSPTTTTPETRTLIGVPLRCGPGEVASKGKCREYL